MIFFDIKQVLTGKFPEALRKGLTFYELDKGYLDTKIIGTFIKEMDPSLKVKRVEDLSDVYQSNMFIKFFYILDCSKFKDKNEIVRAVRFLEKSKNTQPALILYSKAREGNSLDFQECVDLNNKIVEEDLGDVKNLQLVLTHAIRQFYPNMKLDKSDVKTICKAIKDDTESFEESYYVTFLYMAPNLLFNADGSLDKKIFSKVFQNKTTKRYYESYTEIAEFLKHKNVDKFYKYLQRVSLDKSYEFQQLLVMIKNVLIDLISVKLNDKDFPEKGWTSYKCQFVAKLVQDIAIDDLVQFNKILLDTKSSNLFDWCVRLGFIFKKR